MDVLIDLDAAPSPPPPRPPSLRLPRLDPRLLLAVGLLLTLVVPAAAAPRPAPLTQLFTVPLSAEPTYAVGADTLYVATGSAVVTAYALPGGGQRWTRRLDQLVEAVTLVEPAHVAIATVEDGATLGLTALDTASGALLWQRSDLVLPLVTAAGELVAMQVTVVGGTQHVFVLDPRTGIAHATREIPAVGGVRRNGDAADSGTVLLAGTTPGRLDIELINTSDGGTLVRGDLARDESELREPLLNTTVNLVGRLLVVVAVRPDQLAVAYAFDATTLAPLWRTVLPAVAEFAHDCAGVVCLSGDGRTVTLDPATGAVRGFADWPGVIPVGPGVLLGEEESAAVSVVGTDLATRVNLDGWQLRTLLPWPLLVRSGSNPRDQFVAVLDPTAVGGHDSVLRQFGALHVGPVGSCQAAPGYLVCYALNSGLVAATLPRS